MMPTARECMCCREIHQVAQVMEASDPDIQCICVHAGFHPICLNPHVLEVAYYQYRQQYGERQEQGNA